MYDVLRARFAGSGLDLIEHPDEGWVEVPGFGAHGHWRLVGHADEARRVIVIYSLLGEVGADRRIEAALLVARLNFGLIMGSFDLDLDSGDVRLRTSLEFPDGRVDQRQLDHLVGFNLVTADRYLPLLDRVRAGEDAESVWRDLGPTDGA